MTRKIYLKWYWMPASVLLLGLLSVVLLVWTERIHEKQRIKNLTVDAIMDLQIYTATFHLWFEEALTGGSAQDMKEAWEDYSRAVKSVEALLNGGETEHGPISPLIDRDLRNRMEGIKTLLTTLQTIALIRLRGSAGAGIGSDLDHEFDRVFGQIMTEAVELENAVTYELARNEELSDRLFLGIILVWTTIVFVAALGLMNRERRREASEEELRSAHAQLLSQAEELKGHREHLTELVDTRTRELTSANRRLELEVVERTQAEEALKESQKEFRYISSRLLSVQEEERRKISRELHDELGQSLTLMKLQLRSVERQLREDQGPLREECGNILRYLNTVIENVRRLSKDLSPFILEDLGLTRALRWLVDSLAKNYDIRLVLDVADIDLLFSANAQRSIYRVLQEALTNIVKHSGAAGGASVSVRREGEKIFFSIEDKGKGFDMTEVAAQHAAERGLGLASMEERISMLGGTLTLWSEPGKGTRISFSIPSQEEEGSHESLSHRTG
jgi:signal transduction histidine kinase